MRARRRIVPGLAAIAAGLALPGAALAALGDADPTFGVRGSVPLALPTSGIVAPTAPTVTAFRRLADGTLQVVGSLGDGRRVVLARLRYGADGVRRPGREGTAPVPIGNGAFAVSASVPAGDGGEPSSARRTPVAARRRPSRASRRTARSLPPSGVAGSPSCRASTGSWSRSPSAWTRAGARSCSRVAARTTAPRAPCSCA